MFFRNFVNAQQLDLVGSVREWALDGWQENYPTSAQTNYAEDRSHGNQGWSRLSDGQVYGRRVRSTSCGTQQRADQDTASLTQEAGWRRRELNWIWGRSKTRKSIE
jgi:hypothetical protein